MAAPTDKTLDQLFEDLTKLNELKSAYKAIPVGQENAFKKRQAQERFEQVEKQLKENIKKANEAITKEPDIPGKELVANRLKARQSKHDAAVKRVTGLVQDKQSFKANIASKKEKIKALQADLKKITETLQEHSKPKEAQPPADSGGGVPADATEAPPMAPPMAPSIEDTDMGGPPPPPGPPPSFTPAGSPPADSGSPPSGELLDAINAKKKAGLKKAGTAGAEDAAPKSPAAVVNPQDAVRQQLAAALGVRRKGGIADEDEDEDKNEEEDADFDFDDETAKPKAKAKKVKPVPTKHTTGIPNTKKLYESFLSLKDINKNLTDNKIDDIIKISFDKDKIKIEVVGTGMEIDMLRKAAANLEIHLNNELTAVKNQLDHDRVKGLLKQDLEKMEPTSGEAQIIGFLNGRIKSLNSKISELSAFAKDIKKEKNLQEQTDQAKIDEARIDAEIEVLKEQDNKLNSFVEKMSDSIIKEKFKKYEEQREAVITGTDPSKAGDTPAEPDSATPAASDDAAGRNALLAQIQKGKKLKKREGPIPGEADAAKPKSGIVAVVAKMKNMPGAAKMVDASVAAEGGNVIKITKILKEIIGGADPTTLEGRRLKQFLTKSNLLAELMKLKDDKEIKSFYESLKPAQKNGMMSVYKQSLEDKNKVNSAMKALENDRKEISELVDRLKQFKNSETYMSSPHRSGLIESLLNDNATNDTLKKFMNDMNMSSDEWISFADSDFKHAKVDLRKNLLEDLKSFDKSLEQEKKDREELFKVLTQADNPNNVTVAAELQRIKPGYLDKLLSSIKGKKPADVKSILDKASPTFLSSLTVKELKQLKDVHAESVAKLKAADEEIKQAAEARDNIFDIVNQQEKFSESRHFTKLNAALKAANIPADMNFSTFDVFYQTLPADKRKEIVEAYNEGVKNEIASKVIVSEAQVLKDAGLAGVDSAMIEIEVMADTKKIDEMIAAALKKVQTDTDEKKKAEEKERAEAEAKAALLAANAPPAPPMDNVPLPPGPPGDISELDTPKPPKPPKAPDDAPEMPDEPLVPPPTAPPFVAGGEVEKDKKVKLETGPDISTPPSDTGLAAPVLSEVERKAAEDARLEADRKATEARLEAERKAAAAIESAVGLGKDALKQPPSPPKTEPLPDAAGSEDLSKAEVVSFPKLEAEEHEEGTPEPSKVEGTPAELDSAAPKYEKFFRDFINADTWITAENIANFSDKLDKLLIEHDKVKSLPNFNCPKMNKMAFGFAIRNEVSMFKTIIDEYDRAQKEIEILRKEGKILLAKGKELVKDLDPGKPLPPEVGEIQIKLTEIRKSITMQQAAQAKLKPAIKRYVRTFARLEDLNEAAHLKKEPKVQEQLFTSLIKPGVMKSASLAIYAKENDKVEVDVIIPPVSDAEKTMSAKFSNPPKLVTEEQFQGLDNLLHSEKVTLEERYVVRDNPNKLQYITVKFDIEDKQGRLKFYAFIDDNYPGLKKEAGVTRDGKNYYFHLDPEKLAQVTKRTHSFAMPLPATPIAEVHPDPAATPKVEVAAEKPAEKKEESEELKASIAALNNIIGDKGKVEIHDSTGSVPYKHIRVIFNDALMRDAFWEGMDDANVAGVKLGSEGLDALVTSIKISQNPKFLVTVPLASSKDIFEKKDLITALFKTNLEKLDDVELKGLNDLLNSNIDPYALLELKKDYDNDQIRKGFEKFRVSKGGVLQINEFIAYQLLMTPEKRKLVDKVIDARVEAKKTADLKAADEQMAAAALAAAKAPEESGPAPSVLSPPGKTAAELAAATEAAEEERKRQVAAELAAADLKRQQDALAAASKLKPAVIATPPGKAPAELASATEKPPEKTAEQKAEDERQAAAALAAGDKNKDKDKDKPPDSAVPAATEVKNAAELAAERKRQADEEERKRQAALASAALAAGDKDKDKDKDKPLDAKQPAATDSNAAAEAQAEAERQRLAAEAAAAEAERKRQEEIAKAKLQTAAAKPAASTTAVPIDEAKAVAEQQAELRRREEAKAREEKERLDRAREEIARAQAAKASGLKDEKTAAELAATKSGPKAVETPAAKDADKDVKQKAAELEAERLRQTAALPKAGDKPAVAVKTAEQILAEQKAAEDLKRAEAESLSSLAAADKGKKPPVPTASKPAAVLASKDQKKAAETAAALAAAESPTKAGSAETAAKTPPKPEEGKDEEAKRKAEEVQKFKKDCQNQINLLVKLEQIIAVLEQYKDNQAVNAQFQVLDNESLKVFGVGCKEIIKRRKAQFTDLLADKTAVTEKRFDKESGKFDDKEITRQNVREINATVIYNASVSVITEFRNAANKTALGSVERQKYAAMEQEFIANKLFTQSYLAKRSLTPPVAAMKPAATSGGVTGSQPLPSKAKEGSIVVEGAAKGPPAPPAPHSVSTPGTLTPGQPQLIAKKPDGIDASRLAVLQQTQDAQALPQAAQHQGNAAGKAVQFGNPPQTGATFPGGVTAVISDINPQTVKESFEQIQKNIAEKKDLYKLATMDPGAVANKFSMSVRRNDGKLDKITRTVDKGPDDKHNMQVTLSRDAKDESFLLFCEINKQFSPLTMKFPCKDAEIALKIIEASVQKGMEINLHKDDTALFDLPQNAHLKPLFDHLQKKENHESYLALVHGPEKGHELGKPLKGLPTPVQAQEQDQAIVLQQDTTSTRGKPGFTS